MRKAKNISRDEFIKVCNEELTMARAATKLNLHFNTFKKYALMYGCYQTNQSGKGTNKMIPKRIEKLEDYATRASVRKQILKEGLLNYKCDSCDITEWNGKSISLELDHINGKRDDHRLENLRFLCPNCHSQTRTFRGKNMHP
jgi:Zn finger protein HypA/HybF involved in hydrogenase expression